MYKYIRQHDNSDCGTACLCMVAWHYGLKNSLQFYRECTKNGKMGTNLYGLIEGAQKNGFEAEALNGSIEELTDSIKKKQVKFPFIAHLVSGHFIVVTNIKRGIVNIIDPALGKVKKNIDDFTDIWSGYIVNLFPGKEFVKKNNIVSNAKRVLDLMKTMWLRLLIVFVLSISIWLFGTITALTFETMIDEFALANNNYIESYEHEHEHEHEHSIGEDEESTGPIALVGKFVKYIYNESGSINGFFVVLVIMYIISAIGMYIRGRIVVYIAKSIDVSLTYKYLKKILKLPVAYKNMRNDGDFISRFNDTYRIRYAISNATVTLLLDTVLGVFGGVLLFCIDESLFAITLCVILMYSLCALLFQGKLKKSNFEMMEKNASMQSYFKEILSGYDYIKTNSLEKDVKTKCSVKYNNMLNSYYSNDILGLKEGTLLSFIEMLGNALVLWAGFTQIINGGLTLGSFMTFTFLLSTFTEPFKNIVQLQPTLQSASVSIDRLYDVFDITEEENNGRKEFKAGDICFKDVYFSYDDENMILTDLNFRIKKGSSTAITGKSGTGKSTIAKLISRIYNTNGGTISINNKNILDYELYDYRKNIYYVDNNPFMFENTIRYNIDEKEGEIIEEEEHDLKRISELCHIHEYINSLPFKYNSIISENGVSLSQGQRQRIGVARALFNKPSILILDEALSNLNVDMAIDILKNIRRELPDTTIVLITHTKELVEWCDDEKVLEKDECIREFVEAL